MPFASQNQAKAMFASAAGHSTLDIPSAVASKFVADSAGQKVGKLPKVKKLGAKGAMPSPQPFGSLSPAGPAPMDGDS